MGAGLTNSTSLNDLIGTLVDEMVQEYSYAQRVVRPLIRYKQVPQGHASVIVPRFGAVTVASLTQATAPTAEQITSDGVTLTPVERGVLSTISKQTLYADPFSDLEPYAKTLAAALGEDEDNVFLAAMAAASTGLTVTVNDGAGLVDISLAFFRTGIATLLAANAPQPYFCIMHPASYAKIMADLDSIAEFGSVGMDVALGKGRGQVKAPDGFVAAPYGVPIYLSTKIDGTRDTSATYSNIMLSSEAWGFATTFDHRVDVQENKAARAFDVIAWYAGHGLKLVNAYGCTIEDQI